MSMRDGLQAACGQFEQIMLAQMLRTAGIGNAATLTFDESDDGDGPSDGGTQTQTGRDAFAQLVVQALSGALERAGGVGIRKILTAALSDKR